MTTTCTLYWNGKDLPNKLRELPAETYVVGPVDATPLLTDDEEAGLLAALESLQSGCGRTPAQVHQTVDGILVPLGSED